MTSKEIIIKLIDEKKINGEEAYILLNDILQSEMLETYKALENKKNGEIFKESIPYGIPISPTYPGINSSPYAIACNNAATAYTGSSST